MFATRFRWIPCILVTFGFALAICHTSVTETSGNGGELGDAATVGELGGGSSCKDVGYFSRPYKHKVYKKRRFASRCANYKEQGTCQRVKAYCSKTCTGKGSDRPSFSRPYEGYATQKKAYTSKCQYYKELGSCKSSIFKIMCKKTCAGTGSDRSSYSKPYAINLRVVEKEVAYPSRCAYYKSRGHCKRYKRSCPKTCNSCPGAAAQAMAATTKAKANAKAVDSASSQSLSWKLKYQFWCEKSLRGLASTWENGNCRIASTTIGLDVCEKSWKDYCTKTRKWHWGFKNFGRFGWKGSVTRCVKMQTAYWCGKKYSKTPSHLRNEKLLSAPAYLLPKKAPAGSLCQSCFGGVNYDMRTGKCKSNTECGWAFHKAKVKAIYYFPTNKEARKTKCDKRTVQEPKEEFALIAASSGREHMLAKFLRRPPGPKRIMCGYWRFQQFTYSFKKWQLCTLQEPKMNSHSTNIKCKMQKHCTCVKCIAADRVPCSCKNVPPPVKQLSARICGKT